jgi:hypothetical protein
LLKVELHTHTADDPVDLIPYSTVDLIDRAADLGFQALAITLHERQLDLRSFQAHAERRRIVLIPGVERSIAGKHVLLLNFPAIAERLTTFEELAALKAATHGLVIAPHPYYPSTSSLGRHLQPHAALVDAVEFNAYYTRHVNVFNRLALRWAAQQGKPVVAGSDVHRIGQLGPTYTLVDAEPNASSICSAIRAGRVELRTRPMTSAAAAALITSMTLAGLRARSGARRKPSAAPDPAFARGAE